ncbi:MAG: tetratricopeptide repeat protein [Planctomycetes bacterium]|nr:tetratricopeptide repeat protein [Planctomycetota bacterium]
MTALAQRSFRWLGPVLLAAASASAAQEEGIPQEEWTEIRRQDTVILTGGRRPIEGILLTPGESAEDLLRMDSIEIEKPGRIRLRLSTADIEKPGGLILRQSAEKVYENLRERWLVKIVDDRGRRARAELAMARWCYYPHRDLDGNPPAADKAIDHFENAVFLDPSLAEAYPYLIALFSLQGPADSAPLEAVNREVEVYMLARSAGYVHPAMDYRLGLLLVRRLDLADAAAPRFEAVLADERSTPGQRRQARNLLGEIYLAAGEHEKALALYAAQTPGAEGESADFESIYQEGRIRMRMGDAASREQARALFARALALQPDFAEVLLDLAAIEQVEGDLSAAAKRLDAFLAKRPGDVEALVESALILALQGKPAAARRILDAVVAQAPADSTARAHLALGFLKDLQGDLDGARLSYQEAVKLDPGGVSARLLEAAVLVRMKSWDAARRAIQSIRADFSASREVFAACCRLLGALELGEGKKERAEEWIEYAVTVHARDPALLEWAGLTFLSLGKLDRAASLLESVSKESPGRPATINGLGYLHYQRGDIDEAGKLFAEAEKILKRVPRGQRHGASGLHLAYSQASMEQIRDLKDLEVWIDEFEGADGPEIDGWEKVDRFGVEVVREKERAVFRGVQKTAADGETALVLMRRIEARRFDRASLRLRIAEGRARPSLRLETSADASRPSAGLMVYRDLDGLVKVQLKTATTSWQEPEVTAEGEDETDGTPTRRLQTRAVYGGGVPWPEDSQFHTMEIRRASDPAARARSSVFDVLFDGLPVAKHITVAGLAGPEYEVNITGSTDALGNAYTLEVENFKVFRDARSR